jgi:excinuclease ABC subunit A
VSGANLHNLQDVDAAMPLGRLVAVTGVSGSGNPPWRATCCWPTCSASSPQDRPLARTSQRKQPNPSWPDRLQRLEGFGAIDRVLEVDQTPIGKTPRSCPATYIGFWDAIRKLFAETLEAKARGYAPGASASTPAPAAARLRRPGRAHHRDELPARREGALRGLPRRALQPRDAGRHLARQEHRRRAAMEVDEAVEFFASMPAIAHPLQLLQDVGLGYLTLGQPSPTLSGGEAQRIKLVTELTKVRDDIGRRGQKAPHTLYVLDEPTVGLHMADVEKLIRVLHRLVDGGHSVVVIEHDLDVIAEADWIIDLGPEGGAGGGRIVAAGTPEDVVRAGTHTGVALGPVLAASGATIMQAPQRTSRP